jgi:6-pyruvoyltetrahydropterin/6-carboxytetrahydropterin synthase
MITVERYHDISCGHRVMGHESNCRFLHGHNYRITFVCQSTNGLDELGRVVDFGVIKSTLCEWLEFQWDHRTLLYEKDPMIYFMKAAAGEPGAPISWRECADTLAQSLCIVPFNPTAENMADYLLRNVGPAALAGTNVKLLSVRVEETRKCSAVASL